MDALLHIVTASKWNMEQWNKYFEQWFMLLLSLVDFNEDPQICLQVMLSSKLRAARKYQTFLHTEVGMTDYTISFASVEVILRSRTHIFLYNAFKIKKRTVISNTLF